MLDSSELSYPIGLVLGSSGPYHISRTRSGTDVGCRISRRQWAVVDSIISVGVIVGQKWTVSYQ